MTFDRDHELDLLTEEAERDTELAEALMHQPHDDDRGRRCVACGDPIGIRCCEMGADR